LLGSLLGAQMTVLAFVLDDPTFATEEDYYRKAVDWDARRLREQQSDALGWTARLEAASTLGHRVSVQLRDAQGLAVSHALVTGVAFHNARAAHRLELTLDEVSPGLYQAELGAVRPGLWELRLRANRSGDSYETALRFDVSSAGGSP
jgi:nitrogen fixation protein FixH